jgi:hypothetical protein
MVCAPARANPPVWEASATAKSSENPSAAAVFRMSAKAEPAGSPTRMLPTDNVSGVTDAVAKRYTAPEIATSPEATTGAASASPVPVRPFDV